MARIEHQTIAVDSERLLAFCRAVLLAQDVPEADAGYVAWHLVETNLRGTDTHGVARLPHYVRRLKAGSIRARPDIRFEERGASAGIVDGGDGLGHLATLEATECAARLAERSGAGWVSIRNSSHCGALAPYGLRLAERGMIGIVFTHVDPMVMPFGGAGPFCGTNPICLSAPGADGRTLCLDMATSLVPWNLVANAAAEGVPIPRGWGVDGNGEETTDATAVRALHPFGAHKGSGLGIMIDVFCSMLSGAPFGPDIPRMYGDLGERRRLGGLVGAIAIAPFLDRAVFERRVSEMAARLGDVPPARGFERVRFPGEPELETKRQRLAAGIPVGVGVFAELGELAASCGLPPLEAV